MIPFPLRVHGIINRKAVIISALCPRAAERRVGQLYHSRFAFPVEYNRNGRFLPVWHFVKHFKTITRHRHLVMRHCRRAGIFWQGCRHDLSKYSPSEFLAGAKYYQGHRSPNERERELFGYSAAWLHHKGRNKHHFEYWTDYNPETKTMSPVKMPLRYLVEMFCDRVAASKIYFGPDYTDRAPLDYFLTSKVTRVIHPETSGQLEHLLTLLANEGEAAAFAAIRALLREERIEQK